MAVLSIAALKAQLAATIYPNGINAINATSHALLVDNLIDSLVSKIDGASYLGLTNYDPTRTYSVGMCCTVDKTIVQCKVITTGVYDATKWRVLTGLAAYTQAELLYILTDDLSVGLTPGTLILITDRNVLVPVISEYQVGEYGHHYSYEPDYVTLPIWLPTPHIASYALGAKVAYNRKVWLRINASGNSAVAPPADATNWQLLPTSNISYKLQYFTCGYDPLTDWHFYRADKYGNSYAYAKPFEDRYRLNSGANAIELFQWGNPVNCFGNTIVNARCNTMNFYGAFENNNLAPHSYITGLLAHGYTNKFNGNTLHNGSFLNNCNFKASGNSGAMFGNTILSTHGFDTCEINMAVNYNIIGSLISNITLDYDIDLEGIINQDQFCDFTPLMSPGLDIDAFITATELDISHLGFTHGIICLYSSSHTTYNIESIIVSPLVKQLILYLKGNGGVYNVVFKSTAEIMLYGGLITIAITDNGLSSPSRPSDFIHLEVVDNNGPGAASKIKLINYGLY